MNNDCPPAPGLWGLPPIPLHPAAVPRRAPAAGDEAAPLLVAILHDGPAACEQASQALAALGRDFSAEVVIHPSFSSFALLEEPQGRPATAAATDAADLLILSTFGNAPLPSAGLDRVARWIELKRGSGAALLLLFGRPGSFDTADSDRVRPLRQLAAGSGLELFTPRPGGAGGPHPLCEHLHEREVTMTPTLREALRHRPRTLAMN
ncbi:MAG: hypothetical protein ACKVYV_07215 [Limisphaerales bacterium]